MPFLFLPQLDNWANQSTVYIPGLSPEATIWSTTRINMHHVWFVILTSRVYLLAKMR
jgi:hypothetical protein